MRTSLVIVMSAFLLAGTAIAADNQKKNDAKDKSIVAVIDYVKGEVSVKKSDSPKWIPAKVKSKLAADDIIRTSKSGEVTVILVKDKSKIKLAPGTEDKIDTLIAKSEKANASLKKVLNKFNKKKDNDSDVTAVAGVRGNKAEPVETNSSADQEDKEQEDK